MNVVELKNVAYSRKGMEYPLENIQMTIKQGEVVHLRGVPGAGKSTLIDFILGIRLPDKGEVKVFNSPPGDLNAKFLIGYVPQKLNSPVRQTQISRLIDFIESHYPMADGKVNFILDKFGGLRDDKEILSPGQERKLFFALAQAGTPKLLIVDEPTTFLDAIDTPNQPSAQTILWKELQKFANNGNAVLLVCHDRVIDIEVTKTLLLENGKLVESQNSCQHKESPGEQSIQSEDLIQFFKPDFMHWVNLFLKHVLFDIIRTFKTEKKYLFLTFIASFIWAICFSFASKLGNSGETTNFTTLANAYSFYLAMAAANSTGNLIAEDRQNEILTKLLKVLPLPPVIYLLSKTITSLVITSLLIFSMLVISIICNAIPFTDLGSLTLGLTMGIIPYLLLGLALGYLFEKSKSIQIVVLMLTVLISIPIYSRSILTSIESIFKINDKLNFVMVIGDNIAAHSPFYHFIQLILFLGKSSEYDNFFWIHISWLVWFAFISASLAQGVYRYSLKKESKA